jgi:hypothetical protein
MSGFGWRADCVMGVLYGPITSEETAAGVWRPNHAVPTV